MKPVTSDVDMARLRAFLDQLIPANPARGIPAAGDVGVADDLAALAGRNPAFATALRIILDSAPAAAGDFGPEAVRDLERARPEQFRVLLTETYKAYYARPDMRAKVGVGAHPPHPKGHVVEDEPEALLDALTAPVRDRGRVYRDTTGIGGGGHGE